MMVGDRRPMVSLVFTSAPPPKKQTKEKRTKELVLDESGLCHGLHVPLPSCVVG